MKKNFLSLICIFLFLQTARAEFPMICQSMPRGVHYILIDKPKKEGQGWSVRYFSYNSVKSKYEENTALVCDKTPPPLTGTPDTILATCHIILGPDGGEDMSLRRDGKTGKISAIYVPWGPTGVGAQEIMPCQEGVN